ncbi:hypothetical protein ACMBCN_01530 [Candidatus Liberibacter asiaticus]
MDSGATGYMTSNPSFFYSLTPFCVKSVQVANGHQCQF